MKNVAQKKKITISSYHEEMNKMVAKDNLFILEVIQAWTDPTSKDPRTIHHCGRGVFMAAGETIRLPSKMQNIFKIIGIAA